MINNYINKLGLGTVQFGLDYGISNLSGKTSLDNVKSILSCAAENKINTIDTASTYGASEEVIGLSKSQDQSFDIITKTIPIKKEIINSYDLKVVENGITQSLKRLNEDRAYAILLHDADDLRAQNSQQLFNILKRFRDNGRFLKIGVSVYNAEQIDFILDNFSIDIIQIPMNVFDQRLIKCGALKRLKNLGIEVHVRSAFLQGLVFMNDEDLPINFKKYSKYLTNFKTKVNELKVSRMSACLSFLMQQEEVDKVICGVNSLIQFNELIETVSALPYIEMQNFDNFALDDVIFLNPANWKDN